jgi:plastocyanin
MRYYSRRRFLQLGGGVGLLALAGGLLGCKHESYLTSAESGLKVVAMGGPQGELIFIPDRLRIEPGETVRWAVASAGHSATAYHPENRNTAPLRIPQDASPWDSGVLVKQGEEFEHTFTVEGVYNYYCIPHEGAGMVGIIVVGRALEGPGLAPPQEGLPAAARKRLEELIAWAKELPTL